MHPGGRLRWAPERTPALHRHKQYRNQETMKFKGGNEWL